MSYIGYNTITNQHNHQFHLGLSDKSLPTGQKSSINLRPKKINNIYQSASKHGELNQEVLKLDRDPIPTYFNHDTTHKSTSFKFYPNSLLASKGSVQVLPSLINL